MMRVLLDILVKHLADARVDDALTRPEHRGKTIRQLREEADVRAEAYRRGVVSHWPSTRCN